MLKRSKSAAVLFSALVMAPVLAAGRPACCKAAAAPVASHGCCAAMAGAQASAPKGCCKAPVAPRTETKVKDGAPAALTIPFGLEGPTLATAAVPPAVVVRLARRAHHAAMPDDSPPDLLPQLHVLLI